MQSTRFTSIGCLSLAVVLNLGGGACLSPEDGGPGAARRGIGHRQRRHDGRGWYHRRRRHRGLRRYHRRRRHDGRGWRHG